ncbi:MAG: PIN domain-containing protein [Terriglobales bacterium]
MSADRFFLDTNIFVYCFDDGAAAKRKRAGQLVELALASRRGVVSAQVVREFCNVVLRTARGGPRPADLDFYLDATFAPLLAATPSMKLFHSGLWLQQRYRLGWYDALIVAGAQQARCTILYSEDLQHGQQFDAVRVEDPFR